MRCLLKPSLPVAEGAAAIADETLDSTMASILSDLKPEAAYFAEDKGARTAFILFNLENASQISAVAGLWFLAFNAHVEIHPAMNIEDLKNAPPGIESAVKKIPPRPVQPEPKPSWKREMDKRDG
jgi:hypothetical protein